MAVAIIASCGGGNDADELAVQLEGESDHTGAYDVAYEVCAAIADGVVNPDQAIDADPRATPMATRLSTTRRSPRSTETDASTASTAARRTRRAEPSWKIGPDDQLARNVVRADSTRARGLVFALFGIGL